MHQILARKGRAETTFSFAQANKLRDIMCRHIYISCDASERELEGVKSLCNFLRASNCAIEFVPHSENAFYRGIEESIERADAFVAVVSVMRDASTWLAFELHYASTLRHARSFPRPRVFGLRVGESQLPRISQQIELEWLSNDNRHLLLSASPDSWSHQA